jgi:hypothetical protein
VENARVAGLGILIAISTDAHSIHEFGTIRYGIEPGRRVGLERTFVLDCQPLEKITKLLKRQSLSIDSKTLCNGPKSQRISQSLHWRNTMLPCGSRLTFESGSSL